MYEMAMSDPDKRHFQTLLGYCKEWCSTHQWAVGVGEMALGAAVLTWGLQNGHIHMGTDVVGTQFSESSLVGAASGAGLGAISASLLGSIGVAGAFTFGIPALALIGGGMTLFGAFGYTVGDAAHKFLTPPGGFGFFDASIVAIGAALMIDGARRLITDEKMLALASSVKNGVIHLAKLTVKVIAKTLDELQTMIESLSKSPDAKDATLGIASGVTTATGALIGGHIAAGSVTALGSHALGGLALSLGLVSAPVWPIIAGGAAGLAIGLAGWKAVKHYRNKSQPNQHSAQKITR